MSLLKQGAFRGADVVFLVTILHAAHATLSCLFLVGFLIRVILSACVCGTQTFATLRQK